MSSSHMSAVKRRLEDNMSEGRINTDARLPAALEGKQHFISYDRLSVHKPPQTPTRQVILPPSSSRSTGSRNAQPPITITIQQSSTRRPRDDFADLPPLQRLDEDDEDNEDERTLSRYQKESNDWLLFAGVFALIITLFITNFTVLPAHNNARHAKELLAQLKQVAKNTQTFHTPAEIFNFNLNLSSIPGLAELTRPPTFAMKIRDDLVPTLWYSSLMLTLLGTMLTLCIKQWLMTCAFSTFPTFFDPDPPESLQDAERMRLRRPSATRKSELRNRRKDTLSKTEMMRWAVPWLMYPAVGMFVCGVLAKLVCCMWLLYYGS